MRRIRASKGWKSKKLLRNHHDDKVQMTMTLNHFSNPRSFGVVRREIATIADIIENQNVQWFFCFAISTLKLERL